MSILTKQKYAIYDLIKSMSVVGGFNYDWSTVNQLEYNIGTFPRAFVYSKKEKNQDSILGLSSSDYTNQVEWTIKVIGELTFPSDNPMFDIDDVYFKALDDLKALFGQTPMTIPSGVGYCLNGKCDSFLYTGFEQVYDSKDQFIPRELITSWQSVYSQDRAVPTKYAGQ